MRVQRTRDERVAHDLYAAIVRLRSLSAQYARASWGLTSEAFSRLSAST
jgi:hypothetical protein